MVTGIVLVNVERPRLRQVIDGIYQMPGVTEVYTVAGEYDLVVMIRVETDAELADVIATRMTRDIQGIEHTKTLITLNVDSKVDLESVFGHLKKAANKPQKAVAKKTTKKPAKKTAKK